MIYYLPLFTEVTTTGGILREMSASLFAWFESVINQESEQREVICSSSNHLAHIINNVLQAIKSIVKEIEAPLRSIETHLQQIQSQREDAWPAILQHTREMFINVKLQFVRLEGLVPVAQFYRFNGMWKFAVQQSVFLAAFLVYLESSTLLSASEFLELTSGLFQLSTKIIN
jgi:hypothetical protein